MKKMQILTIPLFLILLILFSCENLSMSEFNEQVCLIVEESSEEVTSDTIYGEISLSMEIDGTSTPIYKEGSYAPFALAEIGVKSTVTITISNTGDGRLNLGANPVSIENDDNNCFTIESEPGTTRLESGESTDFTIGFIYIDSSNQTADISVSSDDPDEELLQFTLGDTALPAIGLFEDGIQIDCGATVDSFEGLLKDMERSVTFTILNTGSADLEFNSDFLEITGTNGNLLTVTDSPGNTTVGTGGETTITLTFNASETGDLSPRSIYTTRMWKTHCFPSNAAVTVSISTPSLQGAQ